MTVGQFLKECSNYEYSKERYDLMKECSELELMEQFISDQKYMKENAMNDDYYSESVDDESLVAIQRKDNDIKKKNNDKNCIADSKVNEHTFKIYKKIRKICRSRCCF